MMDFGLILNGRERELSISTRKIDMLATGLMIKNKEKVFSMRVTEIATKVLFMMVLRKGWENCIMRMEIDMKAILSIIN